MSFVTFPHILYLVPQKNYNPSHVYRRCELPENQLRNVKFFGEEVNVEHGKVYEFHHVSYSPDRETLRRDVLVTKGKNGRYVRMEENPKFWKEIKTEEK